MFYRKGKKLRTLDNQLLNLSWSNRKKNPVGLAVMKLREILDGTAHRQRSNGVRSVFFVPLILKDNKLFIFKEMGFNF
jgi:hypothetical protein